MLSSNMFDSRFDEISTFVIQTTCFDLINLFEHENLCIAECACRYLDIYLRLIVPKKDFIIIQIYSYLIKSLVRLAERQKKDSEATKVLRYLIINQENTFKDEISKLVSFPENDMYWDFQSIRNKWRGVTTLEQEMKLFIEDTNKFFYKNSVEAVNHLKEEIKNKKQQLSEIQVIIQI